MKSPALLICVLLPFGISPVPSEAQIPNTQPAPQSNHHDHSLAVLDFTMGDNNSEVDNWAIGLADFMVATLQEEGVLLLERGDHRIQRTQTRPVSVLLRL